MDIGTTIKGIRQGMDQTQVEFAEGVGMTQTNLSCLELNKSTPGSGTLKKIADYTGVAVPIILLNSIEESDVPEKNRPKFDKQWPTVMKHAMKVFT